MRGPKDIVLDNITVLKSYDSFSNTDLARNQRNSGSLCSIQLTIYNQHRFSQLAEPLQVSNIFPTCQSPETFLSSLYLYRTGSSTIKMYSHFRQFCSNNYSKSNFHIKIFCICLKSPFPFPSCGTFSSHFIST